VTKRAVARPIHWFFNMSLRLKQRRDRIVLCRLTEHEHQALKELCAAKGGRSLSEFVRIEVLNPERSVDIEPLQELVGSMERRLVNLGGMHDELARRIQSLCGDPPTGGACAKGASRA